MNTESNNQSTMISCLISSSRCVLVISFSMLHISSILLSCFQIISCRLFISFFKFGRPWTISVISTATCSMALANRCFTTQYMCSACLYSGRHPLVFPGSGMRMLLSSISGSSSRTLFSKALLILLISSLVPLMYAFFASQAICSVDHCPLFCWFGADVSVL